MTALTYDPPIVIDPPKSADAAVIWLHGLGADGNDFEPITPMLGPIVASTRFVYPHAPMVPVTINQGMVMRAWYDITLDGDQFVTSKAGVLASQEYLEGLIQAQVDKGIAAERIIVAGFSQGGAIALHTALRAQRRLGGLMALSTYLPFPETLAAERSDANLELPIFMGHGEFDPMIQLSRAAQSRDQLRELGYSVQWEQYRMEHSVSPQEINDIAAWLGQVLGT
ncbi:MAG: alpha/beta hydrolase fold domain-containing protein [Gammaproteobacteria bacterium]|nr:alpha/beta hydrolase fold domain-containing protein [Gammaproteobacteria bacterium]